MKPEIILVVDDEPRILDIVCAYLEKEGYQTRRATRGQEALEIFQEEEIALVILDLMLPDLTGEEICRQIRLKNSTPILMLTAKVDRDSIVQGLNLGADDYVTKPFDGKILVARVKALLRRQSNQAIPAEQFVFSGGHLEVDLDRKTASRFGLPLTLTPMEFEILGLMARHPGRLFSREELIMRAIGYDYDGSDRTIDVHIKNIRQKIDDPTHKYIRTVYGLGYRFEGGSQ
ncbi:response regulator transcription factor [Acidaminobacter hydrogenoformans]|uniref:Stage 0 sporulation protein A homolog n=1 Tax=Acidaminobacter hydrogenoformans DSM 2784 TaxID=1120920 RepID=A0A1G5S564_9FIRM|nr:response regulator transcription factor [Acidaminobacter hydrogenoformans]SCZ81473.1 DNA-binding response regulator, OmpR family, contains REC and winged-helix (wHTH) domain [Acidaminobacter hydrogenoformans DSM 2784]